MLKWVMVEEGNDRVRWGTWEELILGGAILRHGYHNWVAVSSELQTRTLFPYLFTPQVCKAKYEVLQEQYADCSAWVEELRRKRVNELRRELEKSEESIGSLESKLETLKSEKAVSSYPDNGSSAPELSEPLPKSVENIFSWKEASRDGSSAGSTQETQTNWLPQSQTTIKPEEDLETKPVVLELPPLRLEKFPSIDKLAKTMKSEHGVNIRRRRGIRKRKDLTSKEGIVGDNNLIFSSSHAVKNTPREKEKMKFIDENDRDPCGSNRGNDDFVKIFDSIMENEHATVFRRRLDSQKRARYKRIIRQHMDLDTIRSRITNKSITSTTELFRDLLLLANNAVVFYSKSTREYKCAFILRNLVTKILHQHYKPVIGKKVPGNVEIPSSPMCKPPAKPRSARPFNCKFFKKAVNDPPSSGNNGKLKGSSNPSSIVGSPPSAESSALGKKSQGKRGKVGRVKRGNVGLQEETPMKVRKRVRVK